MRTIFIGAQENPNGINSYTYNLALELCNRGYKSMVMAFGSCDKVTDYKGVTIKQYKCPGGTITSLPVLYFKSIPYLIKHRKEIDMVMYQSVTYSVIPAFIVRLFGMKTCTIIHSLAEDSPKHSEKKKKLIKALMRLAMSCTKHILTISKTKAQEVKARYGRQCSAILPCGVFMPEDKVSDTDILGKNGIRKGKYFLSIGRIDPIKNLDVLIDAFKKHNHGDYQLVIGGDFNSQYGESIVKRASDCSNIIFPGIVQGDDKAALLKNAMAYCLVSSSEGLPIALLEGMVYCNVPIVSDIPSIKEVLGGSGIGIWNRVKNVEDLAKSMEQVESGDNGIKEQGIIARQIVEDNYTWQKTCDKYLQYVKSL